MKNRDFFNLYMDFDSLRDKGIFPSDIDMIYMCDDNYLVIGEIKSKGYHVKGKQEEVLKSIIDGHDYGGVLLEIEHDKRVQDGAKSVDVADCLVRRAYFEFAWHEYTKPLKVLTWLLGINRKHGGMTRV